ncbi:DNA cytosine methyltransferase [Lacibacter luteus]|uniref:Cytosine-specific methyltransferase n=1 Tax=Lacibacter luteus TaxID=2508719 RepID=A0A4Q1CJ39_9BACT|nr:DNA cytosine methyltransferase [Lacibacter luteus]RXK60661.1 DNA cytosine methyltransferase [Lacibacter luteus]
MEPKTQPTYIDLFAGCGGLSLGLHNAGWKGIFAIEKSPDAFETLEYNLLLKKNHFDWPEWLPQTNHDINKVLSDYKEQLLQLRDKVDMVTGGPPCQGFSHAGLRKENDVRNGLIRSYLQFIMLVRPKMIFFENVRGFTQEFKTNKTKGWAYSEYVLRALRFFKYDVEGHMVDFSKFGIPQKRTRFILVGVRKDVATTTKASAKDFFRQLKSNKYQFLKKKGLPQKPTLSNAISDLLKKDETNLEATPDRGKKFKSGLYGNTTSKYQEVLRAGYDNVIPDSHSFANHKKEIENKFKDLLRTETPNKNISKKARKKYGIKKHMIIPLSPNHPAPTITTLPDDYIHFSEPRILTVREYARIQSFPDWYAIKGKYTTGGPMRVKEVPRYTQIGNAIPPLFGEQGGLVLKQLISK